MRGIHSHPAGASYFMERDDPRDAPEPATVLSTRDVKAAGKAHDCSRCKERISRGSPYRRIVGVDEDGFFVERWHAGRCPDGAPDYHQEQYPTFEPDF